MTTQNKPIGIYYEHPDWFRPLFTELDRRGICPTQNLTPAATGMIRLHGMRRRHIRLCSTA